MRPTTIRSFALLAVAGSAVALAWALAGLGNVQPASGAPEASGARPTAPAGGSSRDLELLPPPRLGTALCPEEWPFAARDAEPGISSVQPAGIEADPLGGLTATPAGMPVSGWLSRGYGWHHDPWTGEREFHYGIDIGADADTEVVSAADGRISRVGAEIDYGRLIDIDHGNGFVTRYAHLADVRVLPGQPVLRGEPIGVAGSTGRSTGTHLHYEVFHNGRRVNPWRFLGTNGG